MLLPGNPARRKRQEISHLTWPVTSWVTLRSNLSCYSGSLCTCRAIKCRLKFLDRSVSLRDLRGGTTPPPPQSAGKVREYPTGTRVNGTPWRQKVFWDWGHTFRGSQSMISHYHGDLVIFSGLSGHKLLISYFGPYYIQTKHTAEASYLAIHWGLSRTPLTGERANSTSEIIFGNKDHSKPCKVAFQSSQRDGP